MATIKTPIRTVFDATGNATGLAEFQEGEAVGVNHGGTGVTTLGSSGQVLKVNSAQTGFEFGDLNFATEAYVDSAVNSLIDSAPGTLDTLNELAAALNDDANFASTINSSIATKLAIADFATYFDSNLSVKNSDNLSEGSSSLYFTEARARSSISVNGNLSYNSATGVISYTTPTTIASLSNHTTDVLSEGSTNLYYTDTRVRSVLATDNIANTTYVDQAEADAIASSNSYTDTRETAITSAYNSAIEAAVATKDNTDEITEGSTNLYYTQTRSYNDFDTRLASKTTTNLAEGSNLYYTADRVNSAFDTRLASKSTTNLSEGSNLYYTDTRVASYLTNNSYATQSYVDTALNNIIDGAPAALDTLNELAAALNDDGSFYSSITPTARNAISVSGDLDYNSTTGVVSYTLPSNTATTDDAIALSIALG